MRDNVLSQDFKDTPYWWQAAPPEDASAQLLPDEVDVAIVGSGYTGLCSALELADGGATCVVLDAGPLGTGASTRSGGMVTGGQKFVVSGAVRGVDVGRQARILEDAGESLRMMQERVDKYRLDADYVRYGRVILAHVPQHVARLAHWAALLRDHAGSAVSMLSRVELASEVGGRRYHGGLLIDDYGGLHPAKYHRALRDAARRSGAILASHTRVLGIAREGDAHDGTRFLVQTGRGLVRARNVIMGTNGYTDRAVPYLQRRIIPVRAYVVATEPMPAGMAAALIPRQRMLSDTQRDLYWIRLSPDGTRMIFGARSRILETDARTAAGDLHRMLYGVWPELRPVRIAFCWTGFVGMTTDRLPHMGVHAGIHYAVGCNGSGVAMMSYLGLQLARKILGKQNRACAFDSDAFPPPPFYSGKPFIPIVAGWYRLRDGVDRALAAL
jgi:glycine/D-amino acid oxidase-like deaminating enzyme